MLQYLRNSADADLIIGTDGNVTRAEFFFISYRLSRGDILKKYASEIHESIQLKVVKFAENKLGAY